MPSGASVPVTAPAQSNFGRAFHAPAWTGVHPPVAGHARTTTCPALDPADAWAGGKDLFTLAVNTGVASSGGSWKRTAAMATWLELLPDTHSPLAGTFGGGGRGAPSAFRKIFAEDENRASRGAARGSESASSSSTANPSRASATAGAIRSASANFPEPYFFSASASPATVPGMPTARPESRDFRGS